MSFSPVTVKEERVYVTFNVSEYLEDPLISDSYILYSDLNQESPGENPIRYNMDSVMQALANILNTQPGERLFRPTFGANLLSVLFQPINEGTSIRLKQILMVSIEQWDTRIKVNRNLSTITPLPDDNAYEIYMVYEISGIQEQTYAYEAILPV